MYKHILLLLLVLAATSLKVTPPPPINEANFKKITNTTMESFLQNGSSNNSPWFIFFKIPNCKYCHQGQMLFNSFFIEYNKRLHFEASTIKDVFQTNFQFGTINCQQSPTLCGKFNIERYPTYYVVQGNGQICQYVGDKMPYSMITYLQQRKKQNKSDKCKVIGKMSLKTKILGYLEPLLTFVDHNTLLFAIAFVIGPFLFGYLYSRSKKQKVGQGQKKVESQKKAE